jgi:hypothetical protein
VGSVTAHEGMTVSAGTSLGYRPITTKFGGQFEDHSTHVPTIPFWQAAQALRREYATELQLQAFTNTPLERALNEQPEITLRLSLTQGGCIALRKLTGHHYVTMREMDLIPWSTKAGISEIPSLHGAERILIRVVG